MKSEVNSALNSALPKETWRRLESLKSSDIVVGIPSYNCAHTINYVVYQTARGLAEFFPDYKAVIIVSDGGSSDGTLEVVKALKIPWQIKIVPTLYLGTSGKGMALRAVFEATSFLDSKAAMVVDSDLRSIEPIWIELLLTSALKGTGLVTPLYRRHKYDGTITNFLCYPLTRALYGRRIRQPIGGDFGLSRDLVEKLLDSSLWHSPYIPCFGIDIFETHTALGEGFDVKQAFLGSKIHEAKDPSKHLASMFLEVAGAMFSCTEIYENVWRSIRGSEPVEVIGQEVHKVATEEVQVDLKKLFLEYTSNFQKFRRIYRKVLSPELLRTLQAPCVKNKDDFEFPDEYWAKSVYSFLAAFKREINVNKRNHLLDALRVLWMGKVASFIHETIESDSRLAEEKIEENANVFEKLKPYLLDIY